ncbi:hypothetical protein HBI24_177170 [Parastagonospora nodorum]|nr:hypothetical protein HBH52_180430 [Parastagonospora nodorum]KAH4101162.1 hypothetical protein HBH46_143110 [Parastagonospora nodorum]KAH4401878.1 hypothetical protein HBH92_219190 [Parastagonospora nodorum]KAH4408912.1 hypothetical protein HBH93_224400 [Parastagonospora nodorum]KAH4431043.1 hypothetical protein HBH91_231400 [Parastagonospora nodorum]
MTSSTASPTHKSTSSVTTPSSPPLNGSETLKHTHAEPESSLERGYHKILAKEETRQLLDILGDPDAMRTILDDEGLLHWITPQHENAIEILYKHFTNITAGPPEPASIIAQAGLQYLTQSKVKSKAKSSAGPWGRFIKISQLKIPDIILEHIETNGTGAVQFFNRGATRHKVEDLNGKELKEVFKICYRNTVELKENTKRDHFMTLFYMLQYYDICQILRPGVEDVGVSMLAEVQSFVELYLGDDTSHDDALSDEGPPIAVTKAARDVLKWCNYGAKLNIFVSRFGPGCIFALAQHLSEDFIKKLIPRSGVHYEAAMNHMEIMLRMRQTLKKSQADELGRNMREFLIRPFRIEHENTA